MMAFHLTGEPSATYHLFLQRLATLYSQFAWGRLTPACAGMTASARLIAIGKPNGGVRRIAIGEVFRRLAGKMLLSKFLSKIAPQLTPTQLG